MQSARAGVREIVRAPFDSDHLARVVLRIVDAQKSVAGQNLLVFVPAKAGCGVTTVALQSGPLDLMLDLPS